MLNCDAENAIYILKVEVGKQIYISYQVTVVCGQRSLY